MSEDRQVELSHSTNLDTVGESYLCCASSDQMVWIRSSFVPISALSESSLMYYYFSASRVNHA